MNEKILKAANSWVGTRYSNYKREKGRGVDCLNFMAGVYTELGVLDERDVPVEVYDRKFWLRQENLLYEGVMKAIEKVKPGFEVDVHDFDGMRGDFWKLISKKGDMLLVKTVPSLKYPNHAVFLSEDSDYIQTWIFHADSVRGKVVEDVMPRRWEVIYSIQVREVS